MSKVEVYDCCVICNKETNELIDKHIDRRYYYIEGAGQLCKECYESAYNFD